MQVNSQIGRKTRLSPPEGIDQRWSNPIEHQSNVIQHNQTESNWAKLNQMYSVFFYFTVSKTQPVQVSSQIGKKIRWRPRVDTDQKKSKSAISTSLLVRSKWTLLSLWFTHWFLFKLQLVINGEWGLWTYCVKILKYILYLKWSYIFIEKGNGFHSIIHGQPLTEIYDF